MLIEWVEPDEIPGVTHRFNNMVEAGVPPEHAFRLVSESD